MPRLEKMEIYNFNELCSLCFHFKLAHPKTVEVMERIEKYLHIKVEYKM